MERSRERWVQAQADLEHARKSLEAGDYEWACFAAQQAAEVAVKAVLERKGAPRDMRCVSFSRP